MWGKLLAAAGIAAAFFFTSTPVASASAESFCAELGGQWDGQYCHTSVLSERNATRDIKMAMPADLVTNPTTGPVIREYLRNLFENWKANSWLFPVKSDNRFPPGSRKWQRPLNGTG